jgi:hypothetical protein
MIETAESKVVRTFLTMLENHNLVNLLLSEYTASGLADTEFATYAMSKITLREGITIKDHTIKQRRDQFKIPANKAKSTSPQYGADSAMLLAHEQRINELEHRINVLEGWINTTFPAKGPRKAI